MRNGRGQVCGFLEHYTGLGQTMPRVLVTGQSLLPGGGIFGPMAKKGGPFLACEKARTMDKLNITSCSCHEKIGFVKEKLNTLSRKFALNIGRT